MADVLFIGKRRQTSGGWATVSHSTGLKNSVQFVVEMLNAEGISAAFEMATDANSIDRLVHDALPSIVIINAIWCPPPKLEILARKYPHIAWIVRIHSEVPFLAMEGPAIEYLREYQKIPGVAVAANSERAVEDLRHALAGGVMWLPNYYVDDLCRVHDTDKEDLNIGCFGAIRPFKNQLIQAIAAMRYANADRRRLRFHMNTDRAEQGGDRVLKNLRALFANRSNATLVEHDWLPHEDFVYLIGSMHMNLAVSLSESFNIVTADAVMAKVPVVTSAEVRFVNPKLHADPTSVDAIVGKMERAMGIGKHYFLHDNQKRLRAFNEASRNKWVEVVNFILYGKRD